MSSSPDRHSTGGHKPTESAVPPASVAEIDRSCRWPVMALVTCGSLWLLVAGALSLLASIKLHAPGFLANSAILTYGRVQPAAWNLFVFGFALQAGFGVALWMLCRLSGAKLLGGAAILVATLFWNVGLKLGCVGILFGQATGVEGLELPLYAAPLLFASALVISAWALLSWHRRRVEETYISQWYLLGALFSFAWIYAAGVLLGVYAPLRGVLQAAAGAWFTQGLMVYWFGFVGLAVLFYLLPKLARTPVPSRNLALFGFWTLALFGGFTGMLRFYGGPFPSWMTSLSVVGSVMTIFPVLAVAMNLFQVLEGQKARVKADPVFRVAVVSLVVYVASGLLMVVNSFGFVRRSTHFTLCTLAIDQLYLIGFFTLAMFGAIYHLVPRLTGREWPALRWMRLSVWLVAAGVGLLVGAYLVGGLIQGSGMNDPSVPYLSVVRLYLPFASTGTLAYLILLVGYGLLVGNLARLLIGLGRDAAAPVLKSLLQAPTKSGEATA